MSGNTWRHNLPCKAHKLLAEMFENGKITDKTSPKVAQSFHSEFSKFTLAVFSNNFRQLRQLHLAECNIFETFNLPLFPNIINSFVTFSVKQSSPTKCQDETTSSASTSTASTSTASTRHSFPMLQSVNTLMIWMPPIVKLANVMTELPTKISRP